MKTRLKALAILGPTASGKTHLALALAQQFPCEIISLDSALVYQGMDIGTAKPSIEERSVVPHHLIDIINPMQNYNAADFVSDCIQLVSDIHSRGRLPLIVGGTMMYFHALTQGLNNLPEANSSIRADLQSQKQQYGLTHLYKQLQQIDPISAQRLEANDSQRIERALEVFMLTGKPLSTHFAEQQAYICPINLHTITLIPTQRAILHEQIAKRFHAMLEHGFVQEVRNLQVKFPQLHSDLPSMRCVGYRQAWDYLGGKTDYATFIEQGIAATRQLAKRQLTWLRKLPAHTVIDPYQTHDWTQLAANHCQHFFNSI